MIGMLAALLLLAADDCIIECNQTIFELRYQGNVVSFGDMNLEECEALKSEIEAQTEPFSELSCEPRDVAREEI